MRHRLLKNDIRPVALEVGFVGGQADGAPPSVTAPRRRAHAATAPTLRDEVVGEDQVVDFLVRAYWRGLKHTARRGTARRRHQAIGAHVAANQVGPLVEVDAETRPVMLK